MFRYMKFDLTFPDESEEKKIERLTLAVEPKLKEEVNKLPTKFFTDNTRKFLKYLVNEHKKKNKAS